MQWWRAPEAAPVALAAGGGGGDGGAAGRGAGGRGAAAGPERLRDDDVHGDAEGLRVLRGDAGPRQIAREARRRRRSGRHCLQRRAAPLGPSSVSLS